MLRRSDQSSGLLTDTAGVPQLRPIASPGIHQDQSEPCRRASVVGKFSRPAIPSSWLALHSRRGRVATAIRRVRDGAVGIPSSDECVPRRRMRPADRTRPRTGPRGTRQPRQQCKSSDKECADRSILFVRSFHGPPLGADDERRPTDELPDDAHIPRRHCDADRPCSSPLNATQRPRTRQATLNFFSGPVRAIVTYGQARAYCHAGSVRR
jgi:hypothetical protein